MLDRRAAIPDDTQPQRLGAPRCGLVPEVELEPHRGYPRREGVVDDRIQEFAPAKDVGEIDARVAWDISKPVVRLLAVDDRPFQPRIHRDHAETLTA